MIWLSHTFGTNTPAYRGGASLEIVQLTSIAGGDTANTSRWSFPNHLGTHVDAPSHFFEEAPSITDYPVDWWHFSNPQMIDIAVGDNELVTPEMIDGQVTPGVDLILVRTGFEKYRFSERYWRTNPGLSPELGLWVRTECPTVRAVGMDVISVTAFQRRNLGGAAHRAFLDPAVGSPVILIEDMALASVRSQLRRVVVCPLRVESADGAPCTIVGYES